MQIPIWLALTVLGALGGLVRHVISTKGRLVLPVVEDGTIRFGFALNLLVGAIFGILGPEIAKVIQLFLEGFPLIGGNYIIAFLAGYASVDFLENFFEKLFGRKSGDPAGRIPI